MGNTCNGSTSQPHYQISHLPLKRQSSNKACMKRVTMSERFRQQVEKLKLQGENMYRLILTVQGQRQQSRSIDMKFIFSYADMEISPQYKFTIQDINHFPIIDTFQPSSIQTNPQIYHKIRNFDKRKKMMKYYNFRTLNDYEFKKGLYEISLYKRLQHKMLQDYFVIYKGQIKQLVMVFTYSYVSLHDVLYYRKMANYEWTQMQLLLLMNMLCQNLLQLKRVNIIHRDIRPSKVFFSPVNIGDSQQLYVVNKSRSQVNNNRFYNLVNLQSARVYEAEYNNTSISGFGQKQHEDIDIDLLTVKGVPTFTDSPIKQALQNQQHKANYNPYKNDIKGIKNTLISLINLQPNNINPHINEQKLLNKSRIKQVLKFISLPGASLQQLNDKILLLLGVTSIARPNFYYNMMRDFYTKQLTICQNIQMNLYFNSNTFLSPSSNQNIDLSIKTNVSGQQQINNVHKNEQYPISGKQYVQDLYIRTLYDLHKKDVFVPFMLQKLAKNFQLNKRQQNVNLLMKVGRYFQQAGVKQNQYYKQAVILLLQLAQQQRISGFYKDHQRLIISAQQIFNKFQPQSKMILRVRCILLKQKAYKQLFASNNNQQILLNTSQPSNQNKQLYPIIQSLINQSYQLAIRSNLLFQQQLQLIYSKAQLYLLMNRIQQAQTFYLTGYQLTQKNYKQFMTVHNCTKYKGLFQHGLAMVDLVRLKMRLVEKTPKVMFTLQNKLTNAKQRFSSINIHPVYVIKCYVAIGDLCLMKQDTQQALNNYQKALNLLHATNTQSQQRSISSQIQLSIIHQIINITHNTNDLQKYQLLYEGLKKQVNKSRKTQKKYSRKGKYLSSTTSNINTSNQKQQQHFRQQQQMIDDLPVIRQQEEDNKMFQSQKILDLPLNIQENLQDSLIKKYSNQPFQRTSSRQYEMGQEIIRQL